MKKEDEDRLKALLDTIALDPRAVREALDLATDADLKARAQQRDEFERWRARAIKRMRGAG